MMLDLRALGVCVGVLGAFLAAQSGCAGSETGNGLKDRDRDRIWMGLEGADPLGFVHVEGRDGTVIRITDAEASILKISVAYGEDDDADDHDDDRRRQDVDQGRKGLAGDGWVADLIQGLLTPALVWPEESAARPIAGFKVKWGAVEGPALRIAGELRLPGDSAAQAFEVWVAVTNVTHFVVKPDALSSSAPHSWSLVIDPSGWFREVELARCVRQGQVPVDDEGEIGRAHV